ncbi:hypothetical protein L1D14_25545 [Vibrio tubiashii]|uniref:hypothetical protein n=1 Tax=Vibrio tubiashii TaxID=29498 RepID=UPI001EFE1BA3|nr:hypothetical protein [Vibrio tubiashii]MCG9579576.1 hypothetical protein [Vibrio tubiashii]
MDSRTQEVEIINTAIGKHIDKMVTRSGNLMILLAVLVTLLLSAICWYSTKQLEDASGHFLIKTEKSGKIISTPVRDSQHHFDDVVATVQSDVAQELTKLLNFTTTTFPTTKRQLLKHRGTFPDDFMVNLDNYKILEKLSSDDQVRQIKFSIIDTPLMTDASSNGTPLSELFANNNIVSINDIQLDKMTLEVNANLRILRSGREENRYNIRFIVMIQSEGTNWAFESMSAWES